jgi:hypothetical protein
MASKPNHKQILVRWGDAYIDTGDFDVKSAKKSQPCWRYTAGFFIAQNQYGLVLSTDCYEKKSEGVAAKMFIPWGMVDKWWEVTNYREQSVEASLDT